MNPIVVLKFGGTSVANASCWNHIAEIVSKKHKNGKKVFLVCSAPSQISNLLERGLSEALTSSHHATLEAIKTTYTKLAQDLGIDAQELIEHHFNELDKKLLGIALLQEKPPRIHAQVMAFGELLLSHLGARYLQNQQLDCLRLDARDYLKALTSEQDPYQHYLSCTCDDSNPALKSDIDNSSHDTFITQGFIASNDHGNTVLLGRGGSDTSAAYFSAMLNAERCEIWTDVPGVYTADPRLIPNARMLKFLGYQEAQELAALGGKVLHPQSIQPLADKHIPLVIKYTQEPEREGTRIGDATATSNMEIKAISMRKSVRLISIDTMRMWQQVGFLADIFAVFKKYHLSVDLVSTSESNLTVTLDDNHASRDQTITQAALDELNHYGETKMIGPCAAISIIGRNMRSNLQKLSMVLDIFKSKQVYLLAQAANDLNLTFVVDEDDAERLMQQMHQALIEANASDYLLAHTWAEEFGIAATLPDAFWQQKRQAILTTMQDGEAHYIYDLDTVKRQANKLMQLDQLDKVFYSIKANHHIDILTEIVNAGLGLECVSIQELHYIRQHFPNFSVDNILFTPNFADKHEYQQAFSQGVHVTVDNLYPLQAWPEIFAKQNILLRIDCGAGDGHHRYVCTAGSDSKFGIPIDEIDTCKQALTACQARVVGLHSHTGSGILTPNNWAANAKALSTVLEHFPDVTILDIGGGLGVVEKPGQSPLDLQAVNETLKSIKAAYPQLQLWLEPGRYVVAEAGALVAKVTQIKHKTNHLYVGINTGMNALIRPALYGAYHHIVNLNKLDQAATTRTTIVGPICESGDVMGTARMLPECEEGDIILIANAGAYGEVMSSSYNMRDCPTAITLK